MRLFTAILLPDHVRRHLARSIEHFRVKLDLYLKSRGHVIPVDAKWVRDENLHVTMKFLGELADRDVPRLCDALGTINPAPPMTLRAQSFDFLPPRGPVRVICSTVGGDIEHLELLFTAIERACEPLGIRREGRKFKPHITLARVRQPLSAQVRGRFRDEIGELHGPAFDSADFALVQSELLQEGPRCTVVAHFPPPLKNS